MLMLVAERALVNKKDYLSRSWLFRDDFARTVWDGNRKSNAG
jgi:hypothetical protein